MPVEQDPQDPADYPGVGVGGSGGGGGSSSYGAPAGGFGVGFGVGGFGGQLRRPQVFRGIRGFEDRIPIVVNGRGVNTSPLASKGGFSPTLGAPQPPAPFDPVPATDPSGEPIRQSRGWQTPGGGGGPGAPPGGGFSGFTGRGAGGSTGGYGDPTGGIQPYGGMPRRKMAGGLQMPTGFAHGGQVPDMDGGIPGPTDTVPAMLTPNEMVMNTGVTSDPVISAILTLLNILGAHHTQNSVPAGFGGLDGGPDGFGGMGGEPQGYSLGGWIKKNPALAAIAGVAAVPLIAAGGAAALGAGAAGGVGAGAAGAAAVPAAASAIPAVGSSGAGLSIGPMAAVPATAHSANVGSIGTMTRFAQSHPELAKYAKDFGMSRLNNYLNPPAGGADYSMPYPQQQPQGYAMGGAVRQPGTFGNFGGAARSDRFPTPTPAPAPVAPPSPWTSTLGTNPDLGGARTAGYFDPRGNQMLINSQREAAQGTADALVRRQMSQADLGGLDPAQRAVAKLQALQGTGRGVQDIMAQTRAGSLAAQDEFYKGLYGQEQLAERARIEAARAQLSAMEQIEYTGQQNRSTKKTKGKG